MRVGGFVRGADGGWCEVWRPCRLDACARPRALRPSRRGPCWPGPAFRRRTAQEAGLADDDWDARKSVRRAADDGERMMRGDDGMTSEMDAEGGGRLQPGDGVQERVGEG